MNLIQEFNEIAVLANVPPIKEKRYIPVSYDDESTPITVWWKRPVKQEEFAGTNEDGFRWQMVHHGIDKKLNNKPF